jgi:hypothetical protein
VSINAGRHAFPTQHEPAWKREGGSWYRPKGPKLARAPATLPDYLARATDWQVVFDLPGKDAFTYHVFPPEVAATENRPDVLLMSRENKWLLALELTCPAEERISASHELKANKYADLAENAFPGWLISVWPIEVGCRGFVAKSTLKALKALHFSRSQLQTIKRQLEDVARRCSYYIWCSRHSTTWQSRPLLVPSDSFKSTESLDA